jgi:hypothetical protein
MNNYAKENLEHYYDKIAYCPMFHSWIRPSFIVGRATWKFRLCDKFGRYRSCDHEARSRIDHPELEWQEI